MSSDKIEVHTIVNQPVEMVWQRWTQSLHIQRWNFASDSWHCPKVENDLRVSGEFSYRMEPKDGGEGFDFRGVYVRIRPKEHIFYCLEDGRQVEVFFEEVGGKTAIREIFDAEKENPREMQQQGWQAILNNFKRYCES